MPRPRIVVDQNIPYAAEALADLGEVVRLPSRALDAAAVREADVLWVRSTVKVGAALLAGSRVRMVATATIGTDHLDTAWLDAEGIAWASAPGSNAPSVQLWWAAMFTQLAERLQLPVAELRVGVVGVGHVGSRVGALARALGCEVLLCDPPRARAEGPEGFVHVDDLIPSCDVVTLHVPLTREGPDATYHLVDAVRLAALRDGAILVNASRGPVIDCRALVAARAARPLTVALDVFEGEPEVAPELVAATALATPHIAGHSLDGKAAGTKMVYDATCAHLGVAPRWTPRRALPPPPVRVLNMSPSHAMSDAAVVGKVVARFYRIADDDAAMRRIAALADGERGRAFQTYRDEYPVHRELAGLRLELMTWRPQAAAALAALGVELVDHG